MLLLLLLLQDASSIDAAAKSVMGMDVRKWRSVDDVEYLARVTRDLWGEAPADAQAFVADKTAGKRARKVDELLASPKFAEHWGRRLSTWLIGEPADFGIRVDGLKVEAERTIAEAFTLWMIEGTGADRPWKETVAAVIEARGEAPSVPELAWKVRWAGQPFESRERAVDLASRALGIRLGCAVCHDHPYDRWTVEDLQGLAAFFVRDRVRPLPGGLKVELKVSDEGEQVIPRDPRANDRDAKVKLAQGGTAAPVFLFGGKAEKNDDRLKVLSGFLTSKSNAQFKRAFANRVWAWIFGKGIVDPPDDFNMRNKPSSPALLDAVSKTLGDSGGVKPLLRTICATEIYACVDTTEPAKAEWSSFRGLIVRPPDHPPKPFGKFKLAIPESWTPLPRRSLYGAPFRVPGKDGESAPATFGLWSGSDGDLETQVVGGKPAVETHEGPVTVKVKDVVGTYTCDPTAAGPRLNWRIVYATVKKADALARYRLEGPADTVAGWRDAFVELLKQAAGP